MLRFVVALEAEARPIVERFRLARDADEHSFKVFRREQTALIVSGVGKVAAAAATAHLNAASGGQRDAAWLNVGVAGHGTRAVGEAMLAHKIRDRSSDRSWYPPQVLAPRTFPRPIATDQVTTVDQPELEYTEPGAFDMEASGFYATACRFASAELVHCLKVVSDGPARPAGEMTAKGVRRLVGDCLPAIEAVAGECRRLSRELRHLEVDPPELQECLERWHFTVTERRELRRLLRRRHTLAPGRQLPFAELGTVRGKEVNRLLREWLDDLPVQIGSRVSEGSP